MSTDTYTIAMDTPRQAGIYCRLSYAPDGSLENVEGQEADCRALAERLGWPISEAHAYHDNSRSAWKRTRRRPAWDAMLAAIDAGEVDAIVVYHGDRLIRQPYDLELLLNIADQRGIRIASVSGTRDLDSPDDRFILRIEAAQACRESDNTSRRTTRGWAKRAKSGRAFGGGRRPFGFESDRETVRAEEARLLREAAERLLAGQSQGGITRWLNGECTTTEGGKWTPRALKNLFLSPRIAGLVEHGGALYEAVWEPVISRQQWEDVRRLLAESARDRGQPGRERRYLLSGVAECGLCGGWLRTKPSGGRNRPTARIYFCAACRGVGRNQELLDGYVEGRVLRLLQDPRLLDELHAGGERPDVGAEIASLERRRREAQATLEDLAEHPEVDPGLVAKSLASFDRKIAGLRSQLASTSRRRLVARMAGVSREEWDAEPVDVRCECVRALFRVVVHKTSRRGPGFDPESVALERQPL